MEGGEEAHVQGTCTSWSSTCKFLRSACTSCMRRTTRTPLYHSVRTSKPRWRFVIAVEDGAELSEEKNINDGILQESKGNDSKTPAIFFLLVIRPGIPHRLLCPSSPTTHPSRALELSWVWSRYVRLPLIPGQNISPVCVFDVAALLHLTCTAPRYPMPTY